jgi:hypothetical protein
LFNITNDHANCHTDNKIRVTTSQNSATARSRIGAIISSEIKRAALESPIDRHLTDRSRRRVGEFH